jgi:hypothetical protein
MNAMLTFHYPNIPVAREDEKCSLSLEGLCSVDTKKKRRDQTLKDSSFCDKIHIFYLLKEMQSHDLKWE